MKFSVITINRNNAHGLQKTMKSVLSQTFTDFEYIVIDGASTDNSIDEINLLEPQFLQKLSWISEADTGIYNAMNKGILKSIGDYLLFLNSGDYLNDESVLNDIAEEFTNNSVDIISGSLWIVENEKKTHLLQPAKGVSLYHCIHKGILHPCTFIKRTLFDTYGLYNEQNKYISDFEFFIKACGLNNSNYKFTFREIACFNTLGVTSQSENIEELEIEAAEAVKRLVSDPIRKDIERLRYLEMKLGENEIRDFFKLKSKPLVFRIISKVIAWIS